MPSTFFGLNTAYTGLLASNAALNTTSNNIANVQTEGYSRQQVTLQAANALRTFQTFGCAGAGVETLAIERIRDEFYDFRYWNNNANLGEYDQKNYYMKQIEAYFYDSGTNAGFKTLFDQMMITGLEEWMKNPNDDATKKQFIGYTEALTEYFNNTAGNLQKLQKDVNQEIKLKVDEINSIAGEIATLNKQINTIELTGVKANELRDRRALLIDELSEIVDVKVTETPIVDANNPDRETGANRFMIRIAGGQLLVDGNDYNGLECVARTADQKVHQTDIDGLYDVYWTNTHQKFNLHSGAMGGALKGLVDLRDGNNNEQFTGTMAGNPVAVTRPGDGGTTVTDYEITIDVNKHYLIDLNKANLAESGIINLGNREFSYSSWSYNIKYDANGEVDGYSYTFVLKGDDPDQDRNGDLANALIDKVPGTTATTGASISYQGVPYYMAQMNEWVRTFSQKMNDILTSGYSGTMQGSQMFAADKTTSDGQYTFSEADHRYDLAFEELVNQKAKELMFQNPAMTEAQAKAQAEADLKANGITVDVTDDSYYMLTALNFNILEKMMLDPSCLANKKTQGDGGEQNDLIQEIKNLATDKNKMSFRGSNAADFLQCILSDVALNTKRAETFSQSFKDVAYTIDTQRNSISGVDEDEEAVNLVKFQNGYNLACKMIQTLSEVYDRLILQTGV